MMKFLDKQKSLRNEQPMWFVIDDHFIKLWVLISLTKVQIKDALLPCFLSKF